MRQIVTAGLLMLWAVVYGGFLILLAAVGSLFLGGCADHYVARLNSDCRLLPDATIETHGPCTVCYHKGTTVAACIVTGATRETQ